MRNALRWIATLVLATTAVVAPASASYASDPLQTFKNQQTNRYMSPGYQANPIDVDTRTSLTVGGHWYIHVWADGTRRLENQANLLCLWGDGVAGATADLMPCDDSTYESWYVIRWNDGTISFQNQEGGTCLEDVSGEVRVEPCDASREQSWF
jgi:hypothetical protein